MSGPAFYTGVINIAKNEDWIVPFVYGTPISGGVDPIDLTGSTIKLEIRKLETDREALVSLSSPSGGITIDDAVNGEFTVRLTRDRMNHLFAGTFVSDLVRTTPLGNQERLWEGTATVVEGTTR